MLGDVASGISIDYQVEPSEINLDTERFLRGLDPLNNLRQVFIHRAKVQSLMKHIIHYDVIDNNGVKIFDAVEQNRTFSRNCCNDLRAFELTVLQTHDQEEVVRFRRMCRGDCCCCFGCSQTVDVHSCADDSLIGNIMQEWSLCRPLFVIKLPNGEVLFRAMGPCCTMRCCVRELNFDVCTFNKLGDVALISSQWTGLLRDELSEINFYGVEFHQDLEATMKALILGVAFLVNALYYKI